MPIEPSPETRLADLAVLFAAAQGVLGARGLDYACAGQQSLAEACVERGLDPLEVMAELRAAQPAAGGERWHERPLAELAQHIVTRFHPALRTLLAESVAAAREAHAAHIARALRNLQSYALPHMEKEERVLFPMLLGGAPGAAAGTVQGTEVEHRDHLAALLRLCTLAASLKPGDAARRLSDLLARLHASEVEHIHLENNVLFRRALCESY